MMLDKVRKLYALWNLLEKPVCQHDGSPSLKELLKTAFKCRADLREGLRKTDIHQCLTTVVLFQNARNFFFGMSKNMVDELKKIQEL